MKKPLTIAALAVTLAACGAPPTAVVVSGPPLAADTPVEHEPAPPTTTTAPPAPPTTPPTAPPAPAPAPTTTVPPAAPTTAPTTPPSTAPPAVATGDCGGWEGLIATHFPAGAVGSACRVSRCESNWDAGAQSPTNDRGLFQINAIHADAFERVTGLDYYSGAFDPSANTRYAAHLYAQQGWGPWTCRHAA